jgi:hypothetical protein
MSIEGVGVEINICDSALYNFGVPSATKKPRVAPRNDKMRTIDKFLSTKFQYCLSSKRHPYPRK